MKKKSNKNILQQVWDLKIKHWEFSPSGISRFKRFFKSPRLVFEQQKVQSLIELSQRVSEVQQVHVIATIYGATRLHQTYLSLGASYCLPLLYCSFSKVSIPPYRLARDWKKSIFICSVQDLAYYRRLDLWQNDNQDKCYPHEINHTVASNQNIIKIKECSQISKTLCLPLTPRTYWHVWGSSM